MLIDSPPQIDTDARLAIRGANLVLIPVQPSPPDIWAAEGTLKLAAAEKRRAAMVLNRVPATGKLRETMAAQLQRGGQPMLTATIGNRTGFATAFAEGLGITETAPRSIAANELRALLSRVAGDDRMTVYAGLKALHLLCAVLWVGGMFFAYVVLRPSLAAIEPPQRMLLHTQVFRKFFLVIWHAMPLILITGFAMLRSARRHGQRAVADPRDAGAGAADGGGVPGDLLRSLPQVPPHHRPQPDGLQPGQHPQADRGQPDPRADHGDCCGTAVTRTIQTTHQHRHRQALHQDGEDHHRVADGQQGPSVR